MFTKCESVARHILPLYRSLVAKELLAKYHFTQAEAANKLGTTQAAISQYLNSKRGHKGIPDYEEIAPLVQSAAVEIAERIAKLEMDAEEFSDSFCELCTSLRKTKKIA